MGRMSRRWVSVRREFEGEGLRCDWKEEFRIPSLS